MFTISTQPSFFPLIIEKLHKNGLIYPTSNPQGPWSRVIIEKPFGNDLGSAIGLQQEITKFLDEVRFIASTITSEKKRYKIYSSCVSVIQFLNPFGTITRFDHMQITVSEEIGIGTRGNFFEEARELRIVQNHMMQILSIIAMEPPTSLTAHSIHDEKVRFLSRYAPFPKTILINMPFVGNTVLVILNVLL